MFNTLGFKLVLYKISLLILVFYGCDSSNERKTPDSSLDANYQTKQKTLSHQALSDSRRTAITRAVEISQGAVVSVAVTELVKDQPNLRLDPFFGFYFEEGRMREVKSLGSGFVISEDGLVVTNQHVVGSNAAKIIVHLAQDEYEAELIGADEFTDIALLKIKNLDEKRPDYLHFGDSDSIMVGEWAIAVGNPFGLFEDGNPTVTVGVVSAVNRDFRPDPSQPRVYNQMIQTDAAINRGNSGGPLLNANGHVIGMNTFIFTPNSGNVGLSFAIPINRLKKIVNELRESGSVSLGYDPGFEMVQLTRRIAYEYNLPFVPQAMVVTQVSKGSPAFEAGILPGDIILGVGNEWVQGQMHTMALLREYAVGDSMHVELLRNRRRYKTVLMLKPKASN